MENMNDYQIQDGDIRKVRRVEIRDDWDSPEQIAHPVSEEKVQEYLKNKLVVMLLPVSTSTKIFHEIIYPNCEIRFLKGRVKFEGINSFGESVCNKCGMFDSMVCIFRPKIYPIAS